MVHIFGFLLCICIALIAGFGATWALIQDSHGFQQVKLNAWSLWIKAGSQNADPYTKAIIAISSEIPLQAAEGIELVATQDDDGNAFSPNCTYTLSGTLPVAQFWTLTAYTKNGQIAPNIASRYSLTSAEIVRDETADFEVSIGASLQSGNWLPVAPLPYQLILRLYDASTGTSRPELQAAIHLKIVKKSCP